MTHQTFRHLSAPLGHHFFVGLPLAIGPGAERLAVQTGHLVPFAIQLAYFLVYAHLHIGLVTRRPVAFAAYLVQYFAGLQLVSKWLPLATASILGQPPRSTFGLVLV